jgi:Protein kinase domain
MSESGSCTCPRCLCSFQLALTCPHCQHTFNQSGVVTPPTRSQVPDVGSHLPAQSAGATPAEGPAIMKTDWSAAPQTDPAVTGDEKTTVDHTPRSAEIQAEQRRGTPPERIGRYHVRRFVGEGAFGRVYEAYDPQLKRAVALKVAKIDRTGDTDRRKRFLREAEAAANLRHPHIVAAFDAGEDGEQLFIASDFIRGQTLEARLSQGRLDRPTAVRAAARTEQSWSGTSRQQQRSTLSGGTRSGSPAEFVGKQRRMQRAKEGGGGGNVVSGAVWPTGGFPLENSDASCPTLR